MAETEKEIAKLKWGYDANSLNTLKQDIEKLNDSAEKLNENLKLKINVDTGSLNTLNSNLEKVYSKMQSQESQNANYSKKSAEEIAKNKQKLIDKTTAYIEQANKAEEVENQQHNNIIAEQDNELNNKKELAAYKNMLKQEEYNNRIANSSKTLYDKIAGYAETYLLYQGFNLLKSSISDVIDEMVSMESQMVAINRVMESGLSDIDAYRDQLIQLAYDYGNTFDNVSDVALRLAQAGYEENEVLALTEKTMLALNTADLDATEATSDMIAVMAQWGLMTGNAAEEADKYGDIIDKINKVADSYPTTSEDIMDALKKTSSAFNIAGASIDETIATIVAAEYSSQRGGKAIGTALGNITQQLKESSKLKIAEALGLDFYTDETKTEFKDVLDILGEMSEKMQALKDEGKENSTEMQQLLSIFTVFRRNIGSSLLGEMAGEDSVYAQVLTDSLNSVGYSLEENSKYMATAEAAQAQFNDELLKLKTEVWDKGVEDAFRSMLSLGTNLIDGLGVIVDKIGLLPTAIAAVTLAFSLLNKNTKASNWIGLKKNIEEVNVALQSTENSAEELNQALSGTTASFQGYVKTIKEGGTASLQGYIGYLKTTTVQTVLLTAKTLLLQAAISAGLSLAITAVTALLDNLIHAQEKYIEKQEELVESNREAAETYNQTAESLELYLEQLNEATSDENGNFSSKVDTENLTDIMNLQAKINSIIKESGQSVQLVTSYTDEQGNVVYKLTDNYREQLKVIKEVEQEERKRALQSQQDAIEAQEKIADSSKITLGVLDRLKQTYEIELGDAVKKYFQEVSGMKEEDFSGWSLADMLDELDAEKQLELLQKYKEYLEETGKTGTDTYNWINDSINQLNGTQEEVNEKTEEYLDLADDFAYHQLFDDKTIENAEDFQNALNEINNLDLDKLKEMGIDTDNIDNLDEFKDKIVTLAREAFPEYAKSVDDANNTTKEDIQEMSDTISTLATDMDKLQTQYTALTTAQNELNSTGQLTVSTFKSLVDNDLLSYLDVVNGKLVVNSGSMEALAESTKVAAIESLQEAAAADIQNLSLGKTDSLSTTAKNAIASFGNNAVTAGNKAATAASQVLKLASALQETIAAAKGTAAENGVEDFSAKAQAIASAYQSAAKKISSITLTASSSGTSSSKSGSSGSSKSSSSKKTTDTTAYDNRVTAFKESLTKMEDAEEAWVKKQQQLGLLSNQDMLYVTKQRISRYNNYLKKIKNATWLSTEDRKKLIEEYTEEIESLELEYFKYLEDNLEDQIDAIEDARDKEIDLLKEANEKKIQMIKDEADAKIAALKKVEDEVDREREKEEYEEERQGILDDISYWSQRTGKEAQENLKKAKQNLVDLDKEWQEKLEDWDLEDQITEIENQRDAQVEAIETEQEKQIASIEASAQKQIDALQAVYDYKVKMFSESDKIVYDNSVISAKNLYNAYKTNFVDPLKKAVSSATSTKKSSSSSKEYETYTIKSGDTLSAIAKKYGTTVQKILDANSYIKDANKIYAGKTLKIPKFHDGGIVGGNMERICFIETSEKWF
jgi:TP901 family phage tail tape measure protein